MDSIEKNIVEMFKNIEKTAGKNSIGKMIASGIGVGIEKNSYLAVTAMDHVYVELETLYKNADKNREALQKKQRVRELANLKNMKNLEFISEQEYYERLKTYRDTQLRQGSDSWYKCTEEIIAYNKRLSDEAAKAAAALYEEVEKMQGELEEKLTNRSSPWFKQSQTIIKGIASHGLNAIYQNNKLTDFSDEISQLTQYQDVMLKLSKLSGVTDEMMSDIGKLNIDDGLETARVILNSSAEVQRAFINGYQRRGSLAKDIAAKLNPVLNAKDLSELGASALGLTSVEGAAAGYSEKFVEILKDSFKNVPQTYRDLGGASAENFRAGFFDKIPDITGEIAACLSLNVSSLVERITASAKLSVSGGASNTYQSTYNFNVSKDTTTAQLAAAKQAETLKRLRSGH